MSQGETLGEWGEAGCTNAYAMEKMVRHGLPIEKFRAAMAVEPTLITAACDAVGRLTLIPMYLIDIIDDVAPVTRKN